MIHFFLKSTFPVLIFLLLSVLIISGCDNNKKQSSMEVAKVYVANEERGSISVIDPREDMVDGSVALVYKAGKKVFIAAEILGEKMPDEQAIINLLGGVKIKLNKNFMLGLAYHTQSQRTRSFHRNIFFSRIWNGKGKREYFGSL